MFVDVGANVGYFAVPIARIVGTEGAVVAFEPAPDSAARLRKAANDAGLSEVISVHETALGDEDGSAVLRADAAAAEDSTKRSLYVEGAEMLVLEGMRSSIATHLPRVVIIETIESHLRRAGTSVADVHLFMRGLSYRALDPSSGAEGLELNAVFVT